jgi:hypothetical protein
VRDACGCPPLSWSRAGGFIDWLIEVDTVRGWQALRTFGDQLPGPQLPPKQLEHRGDAWEYTPFRKEM